MHNKTVSIIIPVYNAEKYLKQCIDSLLEQSFKDFEIICVDDGSKDKSCEILNSYAKNDERLCVITQKQQFAGVARNNGMKIATGKYLLFLDADDFFCSDMLEKIVQYAETEQTEILVFDAFLFDNTLGKVVKKEWRQVKKNLFGEGIKSARGIADAVFDFTTPAPWNKLFLREFVIKNNLQFQAIERTNDLFFVYSAISSAERIGIYDKKLLFYRDNNPMSLQGTGLKTPYVYAEALYALRDYLNRTGNLELYRKNFNKMAKSVCIHNLNKVNDIEMYYEAIKMLQNEILPQLGIEETRVIPCVENAVQMHNNIIVYGAGAVAKAVVKYLLYKCGYKNNQITIVVSEVGQNEKEICGIPVKNFKEIPQEQKHNLVLISLSEEKIQNEIEKYIHARGFQHTVKIGFNEIIALICNSQ